MEQYKENDSWWELYQPKKEIPPTFLTKTFSIDLLEPSLRENVLDMDFLHSLRNVSAETEPEMTKIDSEQKYSQTMNNQTKCNRSVINEENNVCEMFGGNVTRNSLQDETSSYCNSCTGSSSLTFIKKEESSVEENPENVMGPEVIECSDDNRAEFNG